MGQWMITDVVCSRFRRSLDKYERNTGKRHPMQSEVVNAGSKRLVGIDPLDDEHDEGTGTFFTGIVTNLCDWACLKRCFHRANIRGDVPRE
jgi:hypothetical protein